MKDEEFTDLDTLWEKNDQKWGFYVVFKGDVFKTPKKITGKTENNEVYDNNLYWVGGRLICREDCLKKVWKQVPDPNK